MDTDTSHITATVAGHKAFGRDFGTPDSPAGECFLMSVGWVARGGQAGGSVGLGVFVSPEDAMVAQLQVVAAKIGKRTVSGMLESGKLDVAVRQIEPDQLEQMAALVRQHRANLAGGSEG